jgi:flagellar hook-associated protein 1 FlgK
MSISSAIATAMSGLRAAQAGLSVVSANVANAETPGYVRKQQVLVATAGGSMGAGVRVEAINRELDQYVQRQLRVESSGVSYANLRATFYDRLQTIYGVPGAAATLETLFNDFTTAVQALSTSPESTSARSAVLHAAQVLAQQLNGTTRDIQGLRSDAELGLADSVRRANEAMQRIAEINQKLGTGPVGDAAAAGLLDERDRYVDELAELMDINVIESNNNQVSVFTNSGIQLVGIAPSTLTFDTYGSLSAASQWSADPAERTVGTIVITSPNGGDIDLVAGRAIRSGRIAAYLEMRDEILVQAQAQVDELAAGFARLLSDRTTAGTAVSSPPQAGFDLDLTGLLDGNSVTVNYTDNLSGAQRTLTLVRVDDPAALPLPDTATANANDTVLGLDFSGGMALVIAQITAALGGSGLQFSNPSGNTLRVLDDGAGNKVDVTAASVTKTVTSLTGGTAELPFFLDGNSPYTGAIRESGSQIVGFAGRIAVNPSLLADPSRLVVMQTSPLTPAGEVTRPNFIYEQLQNGSLVFSPQSGIGSTATPFGGTLSGFLRQVVGQQGEAAEAAARLSEGQQVVFNALQQRFNDTAAVNIDQEMANLLNLQNAYAANARVMSTVREMIDTLLRM